MEHLLFREVACALFLLLLGAARYRCSVLAGTQAANRSSPAVNWARHVPAYCVSSAWAIYVGWLIIAPLQIVRWDKWSPSHWASDLLGWIAIALLCAGLWLFCYSHYVIGRYWSIKIQIKPAHRLVADGPYRHVRHPLYTALFLGYLGTLLALQSWTLLAGFPLFVISYLLFVKEEEKVMELAFGETYRAYRRQTGMFLPKWSKFLHVFRAL